MTLTKVIELVVMELVFVAMFAGLFAWDYYANKKRERRRGRRGK